MFCNKIYTVNASLIFCIEFVQHLLVESNLKGCRNTMWKNSKKNEICAVKCTMHRYGKPKSLT